MEKVWRWCRRNPATASLAAVAFILLVAVTVGSPIAAVRIHRERERAEANLYAADMNLAQQALGKRSVRRARALLERHRPVGNGADRRGFEWRYLWRQTQSEKREVLRLPAPSRSMAFLDDTNILAIGNKVWDMRSSATPVFELPVGSRVIGYSAAHRMIFARSPAGFLGWRQEGWRPLDLHLPEAVHAIDFSRDGKWMATGGDRLILWSWDGESWHQLATLPLRFEAWHNVKHLSFSPDGRKLITGHGFAYSNECEVNAWSVPELAPVPRFQGKVGDVSCVSYSPDGLHVVMGCWNGRIRLWDAETRAEVTSTMKQNGYIADLAFSPSDPTALMTISSEGSLHLWDYKTSTVLAALHGPEQQAWALAFAPDGRTVATCELNGRVALWSVSTPRHEAGALTKEGPNVMPLAFSADSRLLVTLDARGSVRWWDVTTASEVTDRRWQLDLTGVQVRDFEVIAPVMSADLTTLGIGMESGDVQLWNVGDRSQRILRAHGQRLRNLMLSRNGDSLATVGQDQKLSLWDRKRLEKVWELTLSDQLPDYTFNVPMAWSSDESVLAIAAAGRILLVNAGSRQVLHSMKASPVVISIEFSPDGGKLISSHQDFQVNVWDTRHGTLISRIESSHQEGAYDFAFSPDGRTLASVVDTVKLWNVATWQEVAALEGHERNIFAALFSPDGNSLVTADYGGVVRLWTAPSWIEISAAEKVR